MTSTNYLKHYLGIRPITEYLSCYIILIHGNLLDTITAYVNDIVSTSERIFEHEDRLKQSILF